MRLHDACDAALPPADCAFSFPMPNRRSSNTRHELGGCGIGTEEVWRNLLAGKSGIARVTQFDVSAFDCQIAGEVKGFDPM